MKSNRWRFGLRTLLIVVTLCAIVMAFVGNRMYRDFLQVRAIEAIKKAKGQMVQNKEEDATRVLFKGAEFGDDELRLIAPHLRNLPKLEELDFVRTHITDDGIESLACLHQIKELYLFETKVTQEGMSELGRRIPDVLIKTEEPEPISSGMAMMPVYSHAMVALDWTPDGSYLATGSGDGEIRIWNMDSYEPIYQWKAHDDWAFAIAYSPDGKIIATGGGDDAIRLWDAETHLLLDELLGHIDDVHSLGFTPDGQRLISAGDDATIRIWDVPTRSEIRMLEGHEAQIPAIAISPDGKLIASASRDDTVRMWDLESGEMIAVLPTKEFDVNTVAFDSSGKFLASGDQGGNIQIWDLETRLLLQTLTGHNGKVYRIDFDQTSRTLVSCGDDGVRVWHLDTETSKPMGKTQAYVSNVAFHPSRNLLASTSAAGELHLLNSITGETLRIMRTMYGERGFNLDQE